MVKIESADDAKEVALNFLAKMGSVVWSNEVESIKKSQNKWIVQIKSSPLLDKEYKIYLELDADTGKVLSYEKR
ncbi:MAG: hypothetical protein O8C63_11415 [Candidatus Methanoperedens sp.]|nr:hypothetical protein [Candidatus Methanoperedens sp.]